MYDYSKTFEEDKYIEYLRDKEKLNNITESYINRYNDNYKAEVSNILFKESLDCYIFNKIKNDSKFIDNNSNFMINYINHIIKIYRKDSLEFTTNILFRDKNIKDIIYNKYFNTNKTLIDDSVEKNNNRYDFILNKIRNHHGISQDELNFISNYISKVRNPNLDGVTDFIKYLFGDIKNTNLKMSYEVIDALLSYLPFYYGDGVTNVRYCLGDSDGGKEIGGPGHSNGKYDYIAVNRSKFKNVNFKSIKDSKVERLKQGSDITFLIIFAFHEITHKVQNKNSLSNFYNDIGTGFIIRNILNDTYSDYRKNHDSDEIEIMANQIGWQKSESFYTEYYTGKDKEALIKNCYVNKITSSARRIFAKKTDNNNIEYSYSDYDIINLKQIIKNNPKYLEKYPILKQFFSPDGQKILLSYMYKSNIWNRSTGIEFINYFFNSNGINAMINKFDELKLNDTYVQNLISNIYYFINKSFSDIDKIDYVIEHKSLGEYKKEIHSLDLGKTDGFKLQLYFIAVNNYKKAKPLLEKIKLLYPQHINYVEQICTFLEEKIDKYKNKFVEKKSKNR